MLEDQWFWKESREEETKKKNYIHIYIFRSNQKKKVKFHLFKFVSTIEMKATTTTTKKLLCFVNFGSSIKFQKTVFPILFTFLLNCIFTLGTWVRVRVCVCVCVCVCKKTLNLFVIFYFDFFVLKFFFFLRKNQAINKPVCIGHPPTRTHTLHTKFECLK